MVKWQHRARSADVVFMDPPRAGSDEAFLSSLLQLSPQSVVYIPAIQSPRRGLEVSYKPRLPDGAVPAGGYVPVDVSYRKYCDDKKR